MADEIDRANDLNDLIATELSYALSQRRAQAKQNKGTKFCIECGDRIPEGRQKLGFSLCVPCVEEDERKKSLFA